MTKPHSPAMARMYQARENIVRRNVFFASIIYHVRLREVEEHEAEAVPTLATDGYDVIVNPEFVGKHLQHAEGLLLHELCHAAFNHVGRRGTRDPFLWNVACDFSINPLITPMYTLPDERLDDPKYYNKSPEEIYEILEKSAKKITIKIGAWSGPMMEPKTPQQKRDLADMWQMRVRLAADRSEKAGQLHGALKAAVENFCPVERLNWRDLIQHMIREAKSNYTVSFQRPNRRYYAQGMILPGSAMDNVYRLVVCIDTSGSITSIPHILKEMRGEAMSLLDQQIVTHVTLISTDTKVCNQEDVDTSEDAAAFSLGEHGGGTDFEEAMKAVAQVPDAVGCVFLTDMETGSFGKDPGFPVIWVNWKEKGQPKVPFGRVVNY